MNINATFKTTISAESEWLRIQEEIEKPDNPSNAEMAKTIDSIYGITNHCEGTTNYTIQDYLKDFPEGTYEDYLNYQIQTPYVQDVMQAYLGDPAVCDSISKGQFTVPIYVYWSSFSVRDSIKLISPTAFTISEPTFIKERLNIFVQFNDADEVDINYYIDPEGKIDVGFIAVDTKCSIKLNTSGKLLFTKVCSGIVQIQFDTIYSEYSVVIPNPVQTEIIKTDFIAIWKGGNTTHTLTSVFDFNKSAYCPGYIDDEDDDGGVKVVVDPGDSESDCIEKVTYETKHPCTGAVISSETIDNPVSCPEGESGEVGAITVTEYIGVGSPGWGEPCDTCNAEDYLEICCEEGTPPVCTKIESNWNGSATKIQDVISKHPGWNIVVVKPENGVCGTRIDTFSSSRSCCDEILPVEIPENSPEVVDPDSFVSISWENGKKDFSVSVSGQGFWLDSEHSITELITSSNGVTIYTSSDACGTGTISVTDYCQNSDEWEIRCTQGVWVLKYSTSAGGDESYVMTNHKIPVTESMNTYIKGGKKTVQNFQYSFWNRYDKTCDDFGNWCSPGLYESARLAWVGSTVCEDICYLLYPFVGHEYFAYGISIYGWGWECP